MSRWPVQTQGGEVNCVAIAGDGAVVIAGTYYRVASAVPQAIGTYAYHANGTLLWEDVVPPVTNAQGVPQNQGVYWVAVSRNGEWAASAGGDHKVPLPPTPGTGTLIAHEVATGEKHTVLDKKIGGVNMVALSGDGAYMVAGADAAYLFARSRGNFDQTAELREEVASTDSVTVVAISDDGAWVVYGTTAGKIVLVPNAASLSEPAESVAWSAPAKHYIKSIAMAADGSGFAAVTTNRANAAPGGPIDCHAYFFSLDSRRPSYFPVTKSEASMWSFDGCDGVMSVAITADGSRVAAAANVTHADKRVSGLVFFFDTVSGERLWIQPTQFGPNSVSMDASGAQVAVADGFDPTGTALVSPGTFYIFDAYGAARPMSGLLPNQPSAVSWTIQVSADGRAIAAGSDDSRVYYFAAARQTAAEPANTQMLT